MNSLVIAVAGIVLFVLAYRFYGRRIEGLWGIDSSRKTPAHENFDGVDYVPAKHWTILFGHHFSSISGAGPIIGPVIAVGIWGWVPAVLWIVLGTIFIGAVHDFCALMVSARQGGRSIADVTQAVMGYRAKMIFASFLWLALILVIAVFAAVGGKTLAAKPQVVIPTFGLIFNALLVGLMIYRWKVNQVFATLIGIAIFFGLIVWGYYLPIDIGPGAAAIWTLVLLVYAFFASVLPVNLLLQPRDYLSAFVLFLGLSFGYIGLLLTRPSFHIPTFIGWASAKGPLWPMMFVIVACGAISGFHSLIASGTTSKQISSESHAKRIGFGGMIFEAVLAMLALIAVAAGLYWKVGAHTSGLLYSELMKEKGWIVTFGTGYGELVKPIFGALGALVAITMLKTFVLTTLDSATRINRYITEEIFSEGLKLKLFKNRYLATLATILFAGYLAMGNWRLIWPVFGAANQLVAALTLVVITVYLVGKRGGRLTPHTALPAAFMLAVTVAALVYQLVHFIPEGKYLLAGIAAALLALSGFMLWDVTRLLSKKAQYRS